MTDEVTTQAKPLIENAITEYANIFRSIALEKADKAAEHVERLKSIEIQAKEHLSQEVFFYYEQQRTTLIKKFGERLIGELEGQLQDDMIESAKTLISKIEKIRS